MKLIDKVAIVTGASRGVGAANAKLLAQHGAKVILTDINEKGGQAVAAAIGDNGMFFCQDVSSEQGWIDLMAMVEAEFGRLDILVNNAAILSNSTVAEETLAGFQHIFKINCDSVFLGTQSALTLMEKSGGGSIINMSSSAALMGVPHFAAYGASKAAVRSLSQSVAVYCSQTNNKVRCNTIHPNFIATPMLMEVSIKMAKEGKQLADTKRAIPYSCQPEAIANTVLFLASDDSFHINGAAITIDNGATITPPYLP
jgi:3(or 17)beta-hydroxysteroid dehydrogenase